MMRRFDSHLRYFADTHLGKGEIKRQQEKKRRFHWKRKRTADVAEKLGVGLLLGTLIQGVFVKELSLSTYVVGAIMLAVAAVLIVISIALSQED